MILEQLSIYDYLGKESDPLYQTIKSLEVNQRVQVEDYSITLSKFGIYEINSKNIHEAKSRIEDCYDYLVKQLSMKDDC